MNKNKQILFVLKNHFTNDSRVLKEARTLISAGYDVTIRCLWDKGLAKHEVIDNIKIERLIYSKRGVKKSAVKKVTKLIEYYYQVIKDSSKFSIIHCHDLDTLPIGVFMKLISFGKKKLIYDAHEYETERHHIHGFLKLLFKITERLFIYFANTVITVSDGIANEYVRLYNIKKPILVLNCPSYRKDTLGKDIFREKFGIKKDQVIFLYQGGLYKDRGLETVLEAFKNVEDKNKVVVFMGYGEFDTIIKENAAKYENIFYHDAVSPDVLLDYTSSADMGVFFCRNICLSYYYCLPNKLFEYTMAGLPVIVSDLPEMKKIVNKYNNGIVVQENQEDFVKAINKVSFKDINDYKKNISKVKDTYNWEEQEKVLLSIYDGLEEQ